MGTRSQNKKRVCSKCKAHLKAPPGKRIKLVDGDKTELPQKSPDDMMSRRRNLYNNIPRGHPDTPSIINIAKPHNLNPGKYDDLKIILRKEGQNVGIRKYGTGTRECV